MASQPAEFLLHQMFMPTPALSYINYKYVATFDHLIVYLDGCYFFFAMESEVANSHHSSQSTVYKYY